MHGRPADSDPIVAPITLMLDLPDVDPVAWVGPGKPTAFTANTVASGLEEGRAVRTVVLITGAILILLLALESGGRYIRALEDSVRIPGGGRPRASQLGISPMGFFKRAKEPALESARRRVIAAFVFWILYLAFADTLLRTVLS